MSKLSIATMLSIGTGACSTKYCEPSSPCSSPVKFAKMIERRGGLRGEQARELHHRGCARRIVVGAAANGVPRASGSSAPSVERAEVVEVRADDDVLIAQRRIAAAQQREHVLRRQRHRLSPACAVGRATNFWR